MVVLQGPLTASVLQHLTKVDLSKLYFGHFKMIDINGAHCFLTETGFFADLVNSLGSYANDLDKMVQEVLKYVFYFLVLGAAIWASAWTDIMLDVNGEQQLTKMRIKFLEAALNQDDAIRKELSHQEKDLKIQQMELEIKELRRKKMEEQQVQDTCHALTGQKLYSADVSEAH
ncbi:hypothetical protein Sjap_011180 [Stephania japonica]|uniref:Uncharacterized protein n=1 Tax=Stephania japonica TaxID=461633 RepID=A0AAP0JB05_9MAGN